MELEVTFRNLESTEALRTWAEKRFEKVKKHLREPFSGHLTLTVEKQRHKAELNVHAFGDVLHAADVTDDMYAAIDGVMAKMEHAAHHRKDRLTDNQR